MKPSLSVTEGREVSFYNDATFDWITRYIVEEANKDAGLENRAE